MTTIRIASVAFSIGPISGFDDYADHVSRLVRSAIEMHRAEVILFPELSTFELATALKPGLSMKEMLAGLAGFTDDYLALFQKLAKQESVYISAGTQITEKNGRLYNVAYLMTPSGRVEIQPKLHGVPIIESPYLTPGDELAVIDTDFGRLAILTCYDIEFPEPSRIAALKKADLLLVPSATADEQGYWRVRHCAQARCIENQVYVVSSNLLGDTGIPGMSFWGRAAILTPCDKGFPAGGIAHETVPNREHIAFAELDIALLIENREHGAVRPMKDKRLDLLQTQYQLQISLQP
jgi:predicted amidohydrolase